MTVSRALNNRSNVEESTRQKVMEMAKKLGYRPNYIAKSLVLNKTNTIGVVVPEITHSFFPEVIRGIEDVSYEKDYQLILTHSAENQLREAKAINTLESKRVDGILISTAETVRNYQLYKELVETNLPLVFFDRCVHGIGASCVSINDRESAKIVTQHLIDHGYNRIAYLSGSLKVSIANERFEGYKEALASNNIAFDPVLVVEASFHEKGGYDAMSKILKKPRKSWPRAVVAVNDPAAFGAMQAIYEKGLSIPEDIAIVGMSDDIRAELMPSPLTTIHPPAYEVGKKAAQKLLNCIEGEDRIENIIVKTELKIRKSCGCS